MRAEAPNVAFYLYLWSAFGISLAGFGAFTLEAFNYPCLKQLGFATDYCLRSYPLEEALENLGTLFILLGIFSEMKRAIPRAKARRVSEICLLLLVLWLGVLRTVYWYSRNINYSAYAWRDAQHVSVEVDDGDRVLLNLRGWTIEGEDPLILQPRITLFLYAGTPLRRNFGYSLLLVDAQSQEVVSTYDQWSDIPRSEWVPHRITRDSSQPWELATLPANRVYLLTLSFWQQSDDGEYLSIPINVSDQRLLSDTQVVLAEYVFPAAEQVTLPDDALDYRFGNNFALRGAEIPTKARVGETIAIPFTWQAANESTEDWVQFLHFVQEESGVLWNHDQQPLGARLPTRLWYEGLRDTETWQFTLPADLAPGRYAVYTGLYRLSDLERLPVSDAGGMLLPDARVPLGSITISD